MKNIDPKVFLYLFVVLVVVFAFIALFAWRGQEITVATDEKEYSAGQDLRIKIKNVSFKRACFSSCYPYYLERRLGRGDWDTYRYPPCPVPDTIEKCIEAGQTRAFALVLPIVEEGLHRLALPLCLNCRVGDIFGEGERVFSNEFFVRTIPVK